MAEGADARLRIEKIEGHLFEEDPATLFRVRIALRQLRIEASVSEISESPGAKECIRQLEFGNALQIMAVWQLRVLGVRTNGVLGLC